MPNRTHIQRSFTAGEISPRMRGLLDNPKYANGCAELVNFLPLLQGGFTRRPGTRHINSLFAGSGKVRLFEFAPNTQASFILVFYDGAIQVRNNATKAIEAVIDTPYSEADLPRIYLTWDVDVVFLTHLEGSIRPHTLSYKGPGDWELAPIEFTSHPFIHEDDSDTVLSFSGEVERIKVVSDANDFAGVPSDGSRYLEYRQGKDYFLAQILEVVDARTAYIDPVERVLSDLAPSARFAYVGPGDADTGGEHHLRCDTALFNHDHEGAWIRTRSTYDKLRHPEMADGKLRWTRVLEYKGVEDYPTKFLRGPWLNDGNFELGHVYEIVNPGGVHFVTNAPLDPEAAPGDRIIRWDRGFKFSVAGEQFSWDPIAGIGTDVPDPAGSPNVRLDDLTSAKGFDVVRIDPNVIEEGVNLVQAQGKLTFLGRATDPDGGARHDLTIRASRDFFESSEQEVGRFYQVQFADKWALFEVTERISAREVKADIHDRIPRDAATEAYIQGGQSNTFRRSVWGPGDWPFTVEFHEQRLVFGGSPKHPNYLWFSSINDNYDFRSLTSEGEATPDMAVAYPLSGSALNRVLWLQTGPVLLAGTESSEWQIRPNSFGQAITATNIRITQETTQGSALPAQRIGSSVFFVDRSRRSLREMYFDFSEETFKTDDLNIIADHLFEDDPVVDFAYQQKPNSMIWLLTQSGRLASLTYNKRNDFYAWSRHETRNAEGTLAPIQALAVAPQDGFSGGEDTLWLVVERAGVKRLEILTPHFRDDGADNHKPNLNFLDSHTRFPTTGYLADPVTEVATLERFEGKTVTVVVDGAVHPDAVVQGGKVQLTRAAHRYVLVGVDYQSRMRTLPLAMQGAEGPTYGEIRRIWKMGLYLHQSLGFTYRTGTANRLVSFRSTTGEMDASPPLFTGFKVTDVDADYEREAQIDFIQNQPYPLTVLSARLDVETQD